LRFLQQILSSCSLFYSSSNHSFLS
jgi:hypothetical protein